MKYFIITVDTEGDNLWIYKPGDSITTKNASYIPRFQHLCKKFAFKPVYLTNFEMANDDTFVQYAKEWAQNDECEIGIHLHAWNNPPLYPIYGPYHGNPYLIEYKDDEMKAKFDLLYNLIYDKFGFFPVSHRAGRWAMDMRYFKILKEYNVLIDCSHTPYINWENSLGVSVGGSDYRNASITPSFINGVLEIPMSVRIMHVIPNRSIRARIKDLLWGSPVWLRPASQSVEQMISLCNKINKENSTDYLEMMVHSSELMPNGSPYFKTEDDIELLYEKLEKIFLHLTKIGYKGITLKNYYKKSANTYAK